jgi:hypothetical protein
VRAEVTVAIPQRGARMPRTTLSARLAPAVALALVVAAGAAAHTTVRSQATEGVTDDNALKVAHGCETTDDKMIPVVMQSVVLPTVSPDITTSDGSQVAGLPAVIEQGGLNGLAKAIQDRSVFRSQQVKVDALGNVIGFSGTQGALDPAFPGRVPFQFTAPKFVTTSCAARLLVKVAIADVCLTAGAGLADSVQAGKVNLWIPDNASAFATTGKPLAIDGIGSPATLIVNRNLATNPLAPACGAGIDVTVTPSAADVDANLPIPGVWP